MTARTDCCRCWFRKTKLLQLKNLIALLSTDHEDLSETIPDSAITFDQAMEILPPKWSSSSTSYVFYRDDPGCINGDRVLLQRVQKAKIALYRPGHRHATELSHVKIQQIHTCRRYH